MASINPYLNFEGNCEEAFEYYRSVFGGEYSIFQRFSEAPDPQMSSGPGADLVMHVSLPLGDGQVLMGSDAPPGMDVVFGSSTAISIDPGDPERGRAVFDGLADGGVVAMPYDKQFWGAHFGSCMDRYGVHWMVNTDG